MLGPRANLYIYIRLMHLLVLITFRAALTLPIVALHSASILSIVGVKGYPIFL